MRHPAAVYEALLAERLGMDLPAAIRLDAIADETLRSEVGRWLGKDRKDWAAFEHWWRKARPLTSFDPEKKAFVLARKDIDLD